MVPAENAKDEVEHEEGAEDDEGDEEDPVELGAGGVIGPVHDGGPALHSHALRVDRKMSRKLCLL